MKKIQIFKRAYVPNFVVSIDHWPMEAYGRTSVNFVFCQRAPTMAVMVALTRLLQARW